MMKRVLLIALLSLISSAAVNAGCTGSGTTWSCTAGSTSANVQSAVSSASDGATITFAAGTYNLTSWIKFSNSKGATLICVSPGACTITSSTNNVFGGDLFGGTNTHLYRISGFTFNAGGVSPGSGGFIWIDNANGTNPVVMTQIRIDHNTFTNMTASTLAIFFGHGNGNGNYYGVIDHNLFTNAVQMTPLEYIGISTPTPPPSQLGTGNNLFFEDNTLDFASMPNASNGGCTDAWGGAAYVIRHNTSRNCLWTVHGVTHAGGPANIEFYDNSIKLDSGAANAGVSDCYRCFHHQGSGEFIAFNNSFTAISGKNSEVISMAHYRDYPNGIDGSPLPYGSQCDGTFSSGAVKDGNRSPSSTNHGYPCWNQPGRDFATQGLMPMYVWNNYWSDSLGKIGMVSPDFGTAPDYHAAHMQADREWYNAVSASAQSSSNAPFNGSTGMGFGTLSNRPTSCTTNPNESGGGVGYFATDQGPQGTLYRCSATDTWTEQYQPYTYPHPLVGGTQAAAPVPPTNIIAVAH